MNNATLSICTLLLSASLVAQTTGPSLKTHTAVGVYAKQGTRVDFSAIAAGTALRPGSTTSVSTHVNNTHSTTLIHWDRTKAGMVTASLGEQGGVTVGDREPPAVAGTTASPNARYTQGPHSVLLTLHGRAGTVGLVEAWATGGLSTPSRGLRGGYVMDIGNDGRAEFKAGLLGHASTALLVKFPASGTLHIKLQSEAEAKQTDKGGFLYKSGMSFRFRPGPLCTAINYGESCGPKLAVKIGRATTGEYLFGMNYTGGTSDGRNLLIIGDQRVNIHIPGVRCALLTRPIVVIPFKSDRRGDSQWQFKVPSTVHLNLQVQGVDLNAAKASNGVHIICFK